MQFYFSGESLARARAGQNAALFGKHSAKGRSAMLGSETEVALRTGHLLGLG